MAETSRCFYCTRCYRVSPPETSDEAAETTARYFGWYIGDKYVYCPECLEDYGVGDKHGDA